MHKKMLNQSGSVLGLIVAVTITGCAASYKRPESGPIAQARITTSADGINTQVYAYDVPDCTGAADLVGRLNSKTLGDTYSKQLDFSVKANQPFTVSIYSVVEMDASINPASLLTLPLGFFLIDSKVVACNPAVEFMPAEGASYELEHSATTSGCAIRVFKKMPGQANRVADSTAKPAKCEPRNLRKT